MEFERRKHGMLTRRKYLLNVMNILGTATPVRLQKTLFLYSLTQDAEHRIYYFIPNLMGCYSISLHDDCQALSKSGYITKNKDGAYQICNMLPAESRLTEDNLRSLHHFMEEAGCMTEAELIKMSYDMDPFYAIRSRILSDFIFDESFYKKLDMIKDEIDSRKHCIYTIGYEGLSIDRFLQKLIMNNIRILVDVRKNAFSMRREYSKEYLKNSLKEAGIKYLHCPEVGIESDIRKEMLPSGRRMEMFERYSQNVLPRNEKFVDNMISLFQDGNFAFMCYEKNANDCHRTYLASFCLDIYPDFNGICDISE